MEGPDDGAEHLLSSADVHQGKISLFLDEGGKLAAVIALGHAFYVKMGLGIVKYHFG